MNDPIDTEGVSESDVVMLRKQLGEAEKRAQAAEAQVGMLRATCQALETTTRVLAKLLQ